MQLISSSDRCFEAETRSTALNAILTPLVDCGTFSEKLRQNTLQQYTTDVQALLKRITLGLY